MTNDMPVPKKKTKNARHSKETPRWGTEAAIVECCRRVMGGIDLDPCSESLFQETVQAAEYYSLTERNQDGLLLPWRGRVMCNPPGGLVREFWQRSYSQPVDQLMWIGFSVEQLCILADELVHPMDVSFCLLRKRIKFKHHSDPVDRPSHANYVAGINVDPDAFEREFAPLGRVSHGKLALERNLKWA